jgi:hypothetical protein
LAEGRKYGRLKYGKYSYDLWPAWYPIPPDGFPGDIWVPIPDLPVPPVWASEESSPSEVWVGVGMAVSNWGASTFNQTEIWIPVTVPRFE